MDIGYDRVTSSGIYAVLSGKEKVLVQIGFLGQHFSLRFLFLCVDITCFPILFAFCTPLFRWKGQP